MTAWELMRFLATLPPHANIQWEVNGGEYSGDLELSPENVEVSDWESVDATGRRFHGKGIMVQL